MNRQEDLAGENPEIGEALKHFKAGMDAWSNAALSRPRMAEARVRRSNWRPAAGWAFGCLLIACSVTVAVHHFVQRQMVGPAAQIVRQKPAVQQTAAAKISVQTQRSAPMRAVVKQEPGTIDEDLLASVDKDVSQQVPDAMEPLAQLMDDNGAQ